MKEVVNIRYFLFNEWLNTIANMSLDIKIAYPTATND